MNKEQNLIKRRTAIYVRVSSIKQNEEKTIESQIDVLVEHANKNDFEVPEGWIFQDNGISGSTMQRPALDNLRDLIAGGSPDALLIYHPDRLARKYVHQAILLEEFAKCGVEVVFYKNKKAETPEEHLLEQFQGIFAEYERAQITERCRRGRLHKAKQGSITTLPNAPYGYRYIKDEKCNLSRWEIHQEESETILRIFQMFAVEGMNIKSIASIMTKSGKKPRKSQLGWDRSTIRKMLHNRAYIGLAGFCKTEKCEGDSQRIVRAPKNGRIQISTDARKWLPEEHWITIPVPAIIPESLYRMAKDRLENQRHFASRNTRNPSILQGILVCGLCGKSYYKKSRRNKYTYYCCHQSVAKCEKKCSNRSIRQTELDDYIWNWVISMLSNPKLVEEEIKRRSIENSDGKHVSERKMSLQREKNKLDASRNKLLDAYAEGECLSLEELKKRMSVLNQHLQQIKKELAVLESKTADGELIKQSLLTLEKFAESLNNSTTQLSVEEKQRVVRALIHEILIYDDSIKIRHCIPIGYHKDQPLEKCPLRGKRSSPVSPVIPKANPRKYIALMIDAK